MSSQNPSQDPVRASFGVGCFHFGVSERAMERDVDVGQYVDDVRNFLSTYPNVEEIQASDIRATKLRQELFEFDSEGEISSADGIKPWPVMWLLEFTIHIPERIQNEIREPFGRILRHCEAKKFKISIHYDSEFPVTFVSGIDGTLTCPSDAIVLIREYLRKYAPDLSPVEFQSLGPSPFHADFFIKESTGNSIRIDKSRGYDDLVFPIPPGKDKDDLRAFISQLETEITRELGLYYLLIQARNRFSDHWGLFGEQVQNVLDSATEKRPWFRKVFDLGAVPKLDELSIELVQYEISLEEEAQRIKGEIEKLAFENGLDRFREQLDKEIVNLRNVPTEKFRRIVQIIQDHNKTITGYRTAVIAALIGILAAFTGGVAGGLVTLLSSK